MFVQIISKNNIDNLLAIDEYQKDSLVVFYSSDEEKQLERYLKKIKEKYYNLPTIKTFKYLLLSYL
ncbi:MAG: hypothetical protein J7L15_08480, partial [Clostridiales bacterium]|nr:hypothetical protein [Clostridiales bacterium]